MIGLRQAFTALCAAAALLPGMTSHAANTVVFGGVGSSAMFNVFAIASSTVSGAANNYSAKNAGYVHDVSSTGIPDQIGNLWVVWDNGAPNSRKIWFYLSVDSTVGVRAYFNSASLLLPVSQPAPANIVPGVPPDQALPADVVTSINTFVFNAGLTDITAADAKVATTRALNLGYGLANPITSAVDSTTVPPVDFQIGTGTSRAFVQTKIGAAPILVFVNKTLTGSGNLGASTVTNINRFNLAGFLNGDFTRASDLDYTLPSYGKPVITFIREPLSGTYNTMEYCIPASKEVASTQEKNVNAMTDNPLNKPTPAYPQASYSNYTKGGRVRAIGTGALVGAVNNTPNSLGYAFWSGANFANAKTNTKYLTVEGCDPLIDSYTGGSYPLGSSVTFRNIKNGGYPIWSLLRIITQSTPSGDLLALINQVALTDNGGDFVRAQDLRVFRSHHSTTQFPTPRNGNDGRAEVGGDVGGGVFPVSADFDFYADTGLTLINVYQ